MKNHQTQPWRLGTIASFGEFSDDFDDIMLTTIAIHNCNCINPRRKSNTPSPTYTRRVAPLRGRWRGWRPWWLLLSIHFMCWKCLASLSRRHAMGILPKHQHLKCNNQMGWGRFEYGVALTIIWSVERIWRTRNEGRVDVDFGKRNFGEQMWEGEWRNGFPLAKIQEGDHGNGEQLHPYPKGGERSLVRNRFRSKHIGWGIMSN